MNDRTPHAEHHRDTERFWAGEFGDEYTKRSPGNVAANAAMFGRVLARTGHLESAIEFGAGIGSNLVAIAMLSPGVEPWAVEINEDAINYLRDVGVKVIFGSMLDAIPSKPCHDLAFTKGVLIHIAPDDLPRAYEVLYRASNRYILLAEYYNPTPVEIEYRGHAGRLWKRDFAGEMLDRYQDLRLVDYGFVYHRDPFPQDDLTWFLMEKRT